MSVVVASRNRRDEVLRTLARHRAPVIYVDNASTDGSADAVARRFPAVDVVRLARNAGAFARTIGVRRVRTPVVAFADDDSWWAPGALATAAGLFAAHPRLGLIGARILVGPENRLDPTCAEMARSPLPRAVGVPGAPLLGFVACGALVRAAAFLEAGGFDPLVRFPGEEERLALDLVDHGWYLSYVDDVVAHHHPSAHRGSTDTRHRGLARSGVLTGAMRLPARHALARAWRTLAGGAVERAGAFDAARDLPGALRHRRVLSARVVAQAELLRRAPVDIEPAATPPGDTVMADQAGGDR